MTTTQNPKPAAKKAAQPAKKAAASPAKKAAAAPTAKKAEAKESKPKEPTVPSYRDVEDFGDALKAAKGLTKDNADLKQALQLVTHLSWKTPGGTVGWANGTTPAVIEYATDLGIGPGTDIPDAMDSVLSAAEKAAAGDKATKEAVGVLARIVRGHSG